MSKRTLGQVVRQARDAHEMTQRQLAARLGVKASHVAYIESNQRRPSLWLVRRIADALELDRKELLFLAHPEARYLVTDRAAKGDEQPRDAWEQFVSDKALLKRNDVTRAELQLLKQVSMLGRVTRPRQFLYVLRSIRQAAEEN